METARRALRSMIWRSPPPNSSPSRGSTRRWETRSSWRRPPARSRERRAAEAGSSGASSPWWWPACSSSSPGCCPPLRRPRERLRRLPSALCSRCPPSPILLEAAPHRDPDRDDDRHADARHRPEVGHEIGVDAEDDAAGHLRPALLLLPVEEEPAADGADGQREEQSGRGDVHGAGVDYRAGAFSSNARISPTRPPWGTLSLRE